MTGGGFQLTAVDGNTLRFAALGHRPDIVEMTVIGTEGSAPLLVRVRLDSADLAKLSLMLGSSLTRQVVPT